VDLDKNTIGRWRLVFMQGPSGPSDDNFFGILEVDKTCQKESRKGFREWSRYN
jgi:hypothetical protein